MGILGSCAACHNARPEDSTDRLSDAPRVEPLYHYCITRRDLGRGTQSAQLVHAARRSGRLAARDDDETNAVALWVRDRAALEALRQVLVAAGVVHVAIVESDAPHAGELMALGCAPAPKALLKRFFSSIPLIKDDRPEIIP